MTRAAFPSVPRQGADDVQHRQQLADAINGALRGKLNVGGDITLAASTTQTTLVDSRISAQSLILFMPTTSAAAAAAAGLYVGARTAGAATLAHASSASTTQTFSYAVLG